MKQLFCFSSHFWVSGSGWKRKSHQKGLQRSLYLHRTIYMPVCDSKLAPKGGLTDCSHLSSFRQFISQFVRRVSIDGRVMSMRVELTFSALLMKASSKMNETELCFKKEFLFYTTKSLDMYPWLLRF